jgi:cob(I)alamin adenosyltransferase
LANRLSSIVTRTGDDGTTGLGDGTRVGKESLRVACMGDVDELNSQVGLLLTEDLPQEIHADLRAVQNDLFDLGAELCLPGRTVLAPARVAFLDERIAHYNAQLPRLQEFILPGGTRASALAHVCRTVCRRAERSLVALGLQPPPVPAAVPAVSETLRQYCNRLSDLLFVLARTIHRHGTAALNATAVEPQWHSPGRPAGRSGE